MSTEEDEQVCFPWADAYAPFSPTEDSIRRNRLFVFRVRVLMSLT